MIKYATIIIGILLCFEAGASNPADDLVLQSQAHQEEIAELEEKIRLEQKVIDTERSKLQKTSASIKRDTGESADNPFARNAIEVFLKMTTTIQQENIAKYQKQLEALRSGTQIEDPYEVQPVQYGEWPK